MEIGIVKKKKNKIFSFFIFWNLTNAMVLVFFALLLYFYWLDLRENDEKVIFPAESNLFSNPAASLEVTIP